MIGKKGHVKKYFQSSAFLGGGILPLYDKKKGAVDP
jgi:hypothetical protein